LKFLFKMIITFALVMFALGAGLSLMLYNSSVRLVSETIGVQAKSIAESAAKTINIDYVEKVTDKTIKMKDPSKEYLGILKMPEYINLREHLWEYKNSYGIKYMYIMARNGNGENIYVVDGFPMDYEGKDISKPGDVEKIKYKDLDLAFDQLKEYVGELTYDNKWGANVATYFPLFNKNGEFVALLAVDIDAQEIMYFMNKSKAKIILCTIIAILLAIMVTFLLTRYLLKPLKQLTRNVKLVQDGDLSIQSNINTKDEIGELSTAFDDMVSVFYENKFSIEKFIVELSKSRKIEDLERVIINEVKNILEFNYVNIIDVCDRDFKLLEIKKKDSMSKIRLGECLPDNIRNIKFGDILKHGNGYVVLIGKLKGIYKLLWLENGIDKISQRERLSVQLFSRYTAIYYENMILIEDMSKKLTDLKSENDFPVWISKIFMEISENERKRLAADLHDEVLQDIIRTKKTISNFLVNMDIDRNEVKNKAREIEVDLVNIIGLIRETCNELMPTFLAEKGIEDSLKLYFQKVQIKCDINIHFDAFNMTHDLNFEESLSVYRVVQELTNNAVSHSKATDIDIMLKQDDGSFIIYYCDNGVGMDLSENIDTSKHLGFHSIKERIKALGGTTSYTSDIGEGLEVSCQFPIRGEVASLSLID